MPLRGWRRSPGRSGAGYEVLCDLARPYDAPEALERIRSLWSVRRSAKVRFGQPLARLVRDAAADPEGLDERLAVIERAAAR